MDSATDLRDKRVLSPLGWSAAAAVVPFVFQYIYIVNSFYYYGAPLLDAGLFAHLLWHNDWLLHRSDLVTYPFSVTHFMPFLYIINGLSYLVPLPMAEFFAVVMGCIYASLAAGMCYVLMVCIKPAKLWQAAGLAVLAVGYSFNGVVMRGVWMPHPEYAIPSFMLLFLALYKTGSKGWATVFFILMLSIREDAGLQLAGVLILLVAVRSFQKRAFTASKADIVLIVTACSYSLFAVGTTAWMQNLYHAPGPLRFIYMGSPAYAHLTFKLLEVRAVEIFRDAPYLWTGFLVSLAWTVKRRNLYLMIGYLAFLPWFVLNWTGHFNLSGILYAYYGFPFVLSMAWPFIAALWQWDGHPPSRVVKDALLMQTMLVMVGLVVWNKEETRLDFGPSYLARWGSYLPKWESSDSGGKSDIRPLVQSVVSGINENPNLGVLMGDNGFLSLLDASGMRNMGSELKMLSRNNDTADTVVYFCAPGTLNPEAADKARQNHLTGRYAVSGTMLCLFTNRSAGAFGTLSPRLIQQPLQGIF